MSAIARERQQDAFEPFVIAVRVEHRQPPSKGWLTTLDDSNIVAVSAVFRHRIPCFVHEQASHVPSKATSDMSANEAHAEPVP